MCHAKSDRYHLSIQLLSLYMDMNSSDVVTIHDKGGVGLHPATLEFVGKVKFCHFRKFVGFSEVFCHFLSDFNQFLSFLLVYRS